MGHQFMRHESLVQTLSARSAAPAVHVCEGPGWLARANAITQDAGNARLGYTYREYTTESGARACEIIVDAEVRK